MARPGNPVTELRPRVPLARVVEALGPTLLRVVSSPPDPADVLDVVIHDPADDVAASPGDLVLGVGLRDRDQISSLACQLRRAGAAGLVVKVAPAGEATPSTTPDAAAVLALAPDASWSRTSSLIRSLLVASGDPAEDLFGLADAVSALLSAPVTIEDRSSRVLAFSGRQDETDMGRRDTILGRQVPARYRRLLEERGVFRRLALESTPVYVEPITTDMLARVAVSVRAGDEVLGSMWAAVREPLSPERESAFVDAAKVVALHLLRLRAGADVGQRLRADLLATVLEGGHGAGEAASRLGLGAGRLCVLAAQPLVVEPSLLEAARQRLAQTLAVHFAAVRPRSAVASFGGVTYVVVADLDGGDVEGEAVVELAEEFLRWASTRDQVVIGVGRTAEQVSDLLQSRLDADRALHVLGHPGLRCAGRSVARFADVQTEFLLLRLSDLAAEDREIFPGRLGPLLDYDAEHGSGLVDTVAAFLDAFGDVAKAATIVHVHPNTFRYRLKRATEISGIDFGDPQARLAVTLQIRLRRLASAT